MPLQKGQSHILAAIFPSLGIGIYVFLLQREQLCAIPKFYGGFAGLDYSTVRYNLPSFRLA